MRTISFLLFLLVLAVLVSFRNRKIANHSKSLPQLSAVNLFDSTQWLLAGIRREGEMKTIMDSHAFIRFDRAKGSISGNGSCNRFGGNFFVVRDSIRFSRVFSTKMYCEAVQATEQTFFQCLSNIDRYEIKDSRLLLLQGDTILLAFNKAE